MRSMKGSFQDVKYENWVHEDAIHEKSYTLANGRQCPVICVNSLHALNQLVGYAKHINNTSGEVYFRGQEQMHDQLLPAIFRQGRKGSSIAARNDKITSYVKLCTKEMPQLSKVHPKAREPLLQHYGIKTRWLDLVDNLWVALWFSIHHFKVKTTSLTYENISPREDDDGFACILLILSDANKVSDELPGYYSGDNTEMIDLRISAPSTFLRPHAQHAILIRPKRMQNISQIDLSDHICVIVKARVGKIKQWLGNGQLVSPENIYPPPFYDFGYSQLLESAPRHNKDQMKKFGSITLVSYSSSGLK